MTIKDVLYIVQVFAERHKHDIKLTVDTFNRLARLVNIDLLRLKYGGLKDQNGFETVQQITDSLLPFQTSSTIAVTAGVGTLPTDYWHKDSMVYTDGSNVRKFDFVTGDELAERRDNLITAPSTKYPLVELNNGTFNVYPTTISSVTLKYLKKPVTGTEPTYAVKTENGIQVYDSASSVQFVWGVEHYPDIVRMILGYLNIPVTNEQVLAYMESKTDKEN